MTTAARGAPTRFERRRLQTRAALLRAAQSLIAEGSPNAPIQDVTERADVGIGTFYNHFDSREELMAAAVDDAVVAVADALDALGDSSEDPLGFFTTSFRLAGRFHRVRPQLSRVLLAHARELTDAPRGLGPRARRDLAAAHERGQLQAPDLDVAMTTVVGAFVQLGWLLHDQPDRDVESSVDAVMVAVLLSLGVPRHEAERLCSTPLPVVDAPDVD